MVFMIQEVNFKHGISNMSNVCQNQCDEPKKTMLLLLKANIHFKV
jgi:hypothetical protein